MSKYYQSKYASHLNALFDYPYPIQNSKNVVFIQYIHLNKDIFTAIFKTHCLPFLSKVSKKCADLIIFQNPLNY